jgi:GxxExxY protein
MKLNEISGEVVDAAMVVHTALGPGLLEHAYQACLKHELLLRDLKVLSEVGMPIKYGTATIDIGYRLDLLVEDQLIVELKAVSNIAPVHKAQLYSYLRIGDKPLGLLLNFTVKHMKDGIHRIANNAPE